MKPKLVTLALFGMLAFISCSESESDEYCNNPNAVCPDDTAIEASACCSEQSCYWTYHNTKYLCDSTDCGDVLNEIITSACVSSSAKSASISRDAGLTELKAQLMSITEQLLVEARSASGCE